MGNLLGTTEPAKNGIADTAYSYDALNRQITETSGGVTHQYSYDLAGNLLTTIVGGTGRTISQTFDTINRLVSITESGRSTTYGYDLNSNIVKQSLPNGEVTVDANGNRISKVSTPR